MRDILKGLCLLALLILVLVYHVAPITGAAPTPILPSVVLRSAETDFTKADFKMTPVIAEKARTVALNAPLEAIPFYYAAMEFDEARDPEKVIALLDETLKRDPRHYYARLWRARMYYRTNRMPEAAQEIVRVLSLDHDHTTDYLDALIDLARDPESHAVFLELLASRPSWADGFIRRANETLHDGDFLLAIASQSKTALNDYIATLASKGDFERAFLIWQSSLGTDQLLAFSWPYDPLFRGEETSSPFGWRTNPDITTRERDGLYVRFNGRGEKDAASQTMMLGPGYAYTLTASMSGETKEHGGYFRWSISCAESGKAVAELSATTLKPVSSTLSTDFFVPNDGCAIQSLSLTARTGEYPFPAHTTVHSVSIRERPLNDAAAKDASQTTSIPAPAGSAAGPSP